MPSAEFCFCLAHIILSFTFTEFDTSPRVRFLRKSKIRFLTLDKSKNGFCVSLLNGLIQDHSGHGASKEPKNPF